MFSSLLYHLAQEYAQFRSVRSVPHTLVVSMNLKCYESEFIKPVTSNCPNTDMQHVKSTHHDLYTNQYSVLRTAISITNICWA